MPAYIDWTVAIRGELDGYQIKGGFYTKEIMITQNYVYKTGSI